MNIKKISALFLSLVMLITSFSAVFAENEENTENNETTTVEEAPVALLDSGEFQALYSMGFVGEEMLTVTKNAYITRAQFTGYLCKLAGYDVKEYTTSQIPFVDVSIATSYYKEICTMYEHGIVSGTDDNMFSPDAYVTYGQACKMITDVLGYTIFAEVKYGGYPTGPASMISELDINDGVADTNPYSSLTVDAAMYMLYNAGRTEIMKLSGFDENGAPSYSTDGTELFNESDIYYGEGLMQSDGFASLYETEAIMDVAVIDGTNYALDGRDVKHLLGSKIKFLYSKGKKTNDRTFLFGWADPTYDNTLTIKASDLAIYDSEYSSTNIVYYKENGKKDEAQVASIATVIYNYDIVPIPELETHWKIKSGTMRLIDNDRDDIYDVAIIEEYDSMYVVGNADSSQFMSGRYGKSLDLSDCDILKIYKNGKEISQNDIGVSVLISYIKNAEGNKVYIYVNDASFTGTVSSKNVKHGRTYYTIDGKEYEIANSYSSVSSDIGKISDLENGKAYKVWLDADGNIAEIQNGDGELRYALLVDVEDYDVDRENSVYLRLIMTDGTDTKVTVKNTLIFDGTKMTAKQMVTNQSSRAKLFSGSSVIEQVIKFSYKNDGTVKEIDIARDNTYESYEGNIDSYYGYDETEFTLDISGGTTVDYYNSFRSINYRWVVDSSIIMFVKIEGGDMEPEWDVQTGVNAMYGGSYNVKLYDTVAETMIPTIGYKWGSDRDSQFSTQYSIVEDIEWVYEDGEELKKIYFYYNGAHASFVELYRGAVPDEVKKGDVCKRSIWNGRVTGVDRIMNLIDDTRPYALGQLTNNCHMFATIYRNTDKYISVLTPSALVSTYGPVMIIPYQYGTRIPVAIYDRDEETVVEGDTLAFQQVVAPNADGTLPDNPDNLMVLMRIEARGIRECIVVK